ncbi:hypothetical protein BJ944DRAFT_159488 [Cunninghamella echinulata]|nr:hypothetical protein BJ944DRAFT_159488 [Cunninghamella echinulata]
MPKTSTFTQLTSYSVKVIQGDLPLILTVPHGGYNLPETIPNRTQGHLLTDVYTNELAHLISSFIQNHYNAAPYMVILNVSRKKVDVNRPIDIGTESPEGRIIWNEYHTALRDTIQTVKNTFSEVLLLDIHGQAHKEGMVELGYLLPRTVLEQDTIPIETILKQSSIQRLAKRILLSPLSRTLNSDAAIQSLLRGNISFGSNMMTTRHDDIKVIPSKQYPSPSKNALYFTGGYTTQTYCLQLDIIQIECPQHLRFSEVGRQSLATAVTKASIVFLDQFYLDISKFKYQHQPKL